MSKKEQKIWKFNRESYLGMETYTQNLFFYEARLEEYYKEGLSLI